jgi:hypothetical protein
VSEPTRAVVNHCPYCGEQDLFPYAPEPDPPGSAGTTAHGGWHCRSCTRVFTVRFVGLHQARDPEAAP